MKSKVFVSCGQADAAEKRTAHKICALLKKRGFQPYLAIQVQTIKDINGGIIRELKNSDYYLLVNFRRECVYRGKSQRREFRGSLFSNQEFAIAYALDFDRFLVVNQIGIKPEGMLRYIGVNTKPFEDHRDCVATVDSAIENAKWKSDYSRRLRADGLTFRHVSYRNHMGSTLDGNFLYLDIHNARPDLAALETTARLVEYGEKGQVAETSHIRSPLKASGRPGFAHTIFPRSHETFDLLCVGSLTEHNAVPGPAANGVTTTRATGVFLNSALDAPWTPLRMANGVWTLRFEILALDFPLLSLTIELTLPDHGEPTARLLSQEVI
jgi:hypothetical protein